MNGIAIVGIGSPHGDDQFGWAVIDEIDNLFPQPTRQRGTAFALVPCSRAGFRTEKIYNPVDLLPALDANDRVILVDAAVGLPGETPCTRLRMSELNDRAMVRELPHHGTHDMGVDHMLRLAESLRKRVDHVELWVGNANSFERLAPMSPPLVIAAKRCAAEIATEMSDARTIAG